MSALIYQTPFVFWRVIDMPNEKKERTRYTADFYGLNGGRPDAQYISTGTCLTVKPTNRHHAGIGTVTQILSR